MVKENSVRIVSVAGGGEVMVAGGEETTAVATGCVPSGQVSGGMAYEMLSEQQIAPGGTHGMGPGMISREGGEGGRKANLGRRESILDLSSPVCSRGDQISFLSLLLHLEMQ